MSRETISSIKQFLFPRGTRRYFFASVASHAFHFPKTISSITHNLALRKGLYSLPTAFKSTTGAPLLFIEDVFPDPRIGSGAPRTCQILEILIEQGYRITFLPLMPAKDVNPSVAYFQGKGVEFLFGNSPAERPVITSLLQFRKNFYKVIIVSRPLNLKGLYNTIRRCQRNAKIIYDAEAVFATRKTMYQKLIGKPLTISAEKRLIEQEMVLARKADSILAVSDNEAGLFRTHSCPSVFVVGHSVVVRPSKASFSERNGILFVGSILNSPSPNEDAVLYFINEILPLIRREIDAGFTIVGHTMSERVRACQSNVVTVAGVVEDLAPLYNSFRIFVAPTRFSAGVPLKVYDAAANGLPAVATPLLCSQLGWEQEKEILCGATSTDFAKACIKLLSDPDLWLRIRNNALEKVRNDCDHTRFHTQLLSAVGSDSGHRL